MKSITQHFDIIVAGGGLAGFCAAIASARQGHRTCLIQDRPVLGGNSSSEVRVTPHGAAAFHAYARETGIISELLIEERVRNHQHIFENGWTNSVWDMVLYDMAITTPNLTLHVNTSVTAVIMENAARADSAPPPAVGLGYLHRPACNRGRKIRALVGRVANAEVEMILHASYFIDCTGDALVADLAGCEWRMGTEAREEYNEPHAPARPSPDTMGNSILFRARDVGRPAPFTPPAWAVKHTDAAYFYQQGRVPGTLEGGYWWIEIGVPWNTIHQAEDIRHELTRHLLGVWDWIKNHDPKTRQLAANYALDWMGQVPGKRESRRVLGRYFLTEHDVQEKNAFPDEIGFGGWFIDLHTPGGLLAPTSEPASAEGYQPDSAYMGKSYVGPYGLPLRILIARDLDNLLMAGRNVSVTHTTLGTVRVMGTTALMGQAAGTACAQALQSRTPPGDFAPAQVWAVQQQLLRDGCFLPNVRNADPLDLARGAQATASSAAALSGSGPDPVAAPERDKLLARRGQWIALSTQLIDTLEVGVTNLSNQPQFVPAWLLPVEHLWDYQVNPGPALAQTLLTVPPGGPHWVPWKLAAKVPGDGFVRLDLGANPQVCWQVAPAMIPGHPCATDMGNGHMRRYHDGATRCYRISPPQLCFGPEQVLSGVTRPHCRTNLWRSDPAQPLPQWLALQWQKPQTLAMVELSFPGHLAFEYHVYPPFYRDPQCPCDYQIAALLQGQWQTLVKVQGNYQRQRRHALEHPVSTDQIRILITATHGDPAAAIYEVRCYGPTQPPADVCPKSQPL